MNRLHESQSSLKPHAPAGIVQHNVDFAAGTDLKREWFIKGTETEAIRPAAGALVSRIAYPTAGTVIALDPDIPQDAQQMFFEASPRGSNLEWMLDGGSAQPGPDSMASPRGKTF
jgi:penicillin-binding protein 1C